MRRKRYIFIHQERWLFNTRIYFVNKIKNFKSENSQVAWNEQGTG